MQTMQTATDVPQPGVDVLSSNISMALINPLPKDSVMLVNAPVGSTSFG